MTGKGNSHAHGNSFANGQPLWIRDARNSGWDIQPVTHWDFTEGRLPA